MLFNPIKTLCEWKQLRGNWMSHSICCPHATAMLIHPKCISLSPPVSYSAHMTVHLSSQSATVLERKAAPHWAMLFIKAYRNPVACLSAQSTSRSSITQCCYLVMFGGGDWLLLVQVVSKHLSFWVNTFLSCSCSHGDSGFGKTKTQTLNSSSHWFAEWCMWWVGNITAAWHRR